MFERAQVGELKKLLKKYLPGDIDVNEIDSRR